MNPILFSGNQGVRIDAANLEKANLSEYDALELHLLDSVAVVIPGEMTGKELIRASQCLQRLATKLLMVIVESCARCDNCGETSPCDWMIDTICPDVTVPYDELIEAGINPESKLSCEADPENHRIVVFEAEERYDITDVDPDIIDIFRDCGICLQELDAKLKRDIVLYNGDTCAE